MLPFTRYLYLKGYLGSETFAPTAIKESSQFDFIIQKEKILAQDLLCL